MSVINFKVILERPEMIDVTAVLFAKSVSSRFPGKNLKPFARKNGKSLTLLEWKIEQLIEVFSLDKIMLSSDSEEILEIGRKYQLKLQYRPLEVVEADFTTNLKYSTNLLVMNKIKKSPQGRFFIKVLFSSYFTAKSSLILAFKASL